MKKRVLHLSLKREPFEVMVTGEKNEEFRKPTKWILSRLYNKDGTPKHYDVIKFTNGYGKDKPSFICEFKGIEDRFKYDDTFTYSNGFKVKVTPEDIIIRCGKIGIIRNYIDADSLFDKLSRIVGQEVKTIYISK